MYTQPGPKGGVAPPNAIICQSRQQRSESSTLQPFPRPPRSLARATHAIIVRMYWILLSHLRMDHGAVPVASLSARCDLGASIACPTWRPCIALRAHLARFHLICFNYTLAVLKFHLAYVVQILLLLTNAPWYVHFTLSGSKLSCQCTGCLS